ncbi:nucleotidyltransferase domain-containing protein [Micromonospora wenchangensis]|uniref:nucleotidyltransferase domain-containing protein n=1 Tax=Micromonospora wenchangensis TaxID=1185415 RepID=UPI003D74A805
MAVNSDNYNVDKIVDAVRATRPDVEGIVLVGSFARGEQHALSDLDVICLGNDLPEYELTVWDSRLVALQGKSVAQAQEDLLDPAICAQAVPSWRTARILHDPDGVAASVRAQAQAWDWPLVQGRLEQWAAETVTGFAEEALKLMAAIRDRRDVAAAAQAQLIAVHLTPVMAAAHHELFTSENALWHGTAGDPRWFEALARVLPSEHWTAARGAVGLYLYAVDATYAWMSPAQRGVADFVRASTGELDR